MEKGSGRPPLTAACTPGLAHLLHHIQLGVLGLEELHKQLQHLGVQQLVAGADLQTGQKQPR